MEHVHFVTGRLAEHALGDLLARLAPQAGFEYSVSVMPITVAALMTPDWIARRLQVPPHASRVVVPGYCSGDLTPVEGVAKVPVVRGPRDLRELPEFFGRPQPKHQFGRHDIQIVAEINHAPRLPREEILRQARQLADDGADLIDVGCDPGDPWPGVADCTAALRDEGHRVSIDSLNPVEIEAAVNAGAELVLSVQSSNRAAAPDWGCEVVVIPDDPRSPAELAETIEFLAVRGVPLRVDPILEPIGCGFAESLGRYLAVRRKYPEAEMLMGIGNLTELTDVDSAAVNVLLLGFCQEVGVRSVLTTQVINWARSCVRECDLARQLVYFAIQHQIPPKNVSQDLVILRDRQLHRYGEELDRLASQIKDHNYRIFAEDEEIHLLGGGKHLRDRDPFRLFEKLLLTNPPAVDATHAFYLGFEFAKALTALTLGKQYEQDEALDWGFLTVAEDHHRLARPRPNRP